MVTPSPRKIINETESTYTTMRASGEQVDIAFIKSGNGHTGHLEIAISDTHNEEKSIKLSIDEVRLVLKLLQRPEVLAELN